MPLFNIIYLTISELTGSVDEGTAELIDMTPCDGIMPDGLEKRWLDTRMLSSSWTLTPTWICCSSFSQSFGSTNSLFSLSWWAFWNWLFKSYCFERRVWIIWFCYSLSFKPARIWFCGSPSGKPEKIWFFSSLTSPNCFFVSHSLTRVYSSSIEPSPHI